MKRTLVAVLVVLLAGAAGAHGSTSAAPKPRLGGVLVIASGDPGPLNPAISSSGQLHPVTGQIFNVDGGQIMRS